MRKIISSLVFLLLLGCPAWAQVGGNVASQNVIIQDVDGTPKGKLRTLKVTNGTLTKEAEGVYRLSSGSQTPWTSDIDGAGYNLTNTGTGTFSNIYNKTAVDGIATLTNFYNKTDIGSGYQPLEATLTDIADGTISENLVNTANPWAVNEVADSYLLNNGDVGTGVYDFGGATSLETVNGASPTVDAIGEFALDTTDDQLVYYGAEKRVITYHHPRSATIPLTVTTDSNNISIGSFPYAVTLKSVGCSYVGTTAPALIANFTLTYGNGTAFTHTSPTCVNQTTAETWQAITTGTLAAGQRVFYNITNAATANYTYELSYDYMVDAQ